MMYTPEELKRKSFAELKEIGYELDVLPEGDRRLRRNWIRAIEQAAKKSLDVEVQEPIIGTVENAPGVEVEPVQEAPLESKFSRIVYPKPAAKSIAPPLETSVVHNVAPKFQVGDLVNDKYQRWGLEEKSLTGTITLIHPAGGVRVNFGPGGTFDYSRPKLKNLISIDQPQESIVQAVKTSPAVEIEPVQEAIAETAKTSPGVEVDRALSHKFLLCLKDWSLD
jgi:hypothetical protein